MAEMLALAAQPRDLSVKARALRRQELVPGVMYGPGYEPRTVQFEELTLTRMVLQAGTSRLIALTIDGESEEHIALIRQVQRDPVTNDIVHIDFYRTVAGQTLTSAVPVVGIGTAPGLEAFPGSTIGQLLDTVDIECLPRDMPESITFDLGLLVDLSSMVTVADLKVPEGVTILTDDASELATLVAQRAEEPDEVEAEIEGIEGVESVEPAEGEAPEEAPDTEV